MGRNVDPAVLRNRETIQNDLRERPDDDVLQEIPSQTKAIVGKNLT